VGTAGDAFGGVEDAAPAPPVEIPAVNRPRGVLLGSASSLVYLALQVVCAIALAPLALSALGPTHYDLWLVCAQVLAWLVLADFGLGQALTNAIVQARAAGDAQGVARACWTVAGALAAAGVVVAAIGCTAPWWPVEQLVPGTVVDGERVRWALAVLVVTFGIRLPLAAVAYAWRGLQEPHRLNAWLALIPPVQLGAAWLAFRLGGGLVALAAVSGVVNLGALLGAAVHLGVRHPALRRVSPRFDGAWLRTLWPAAWPFLVIQLASVVVLQTDNLVLVGVLGADGAVAPYALPLRLSLMVHSLLVGILAVLWPALGDLAARGAPERVREVWARIIRLSMWIAAAGAAGLVVLGRPVLGWWVPDVAWPPEGPWLLAVFAAHLVLRSWVSLHAMAANALGLQRRYQGALVLEACVNLGLSLWLVHTHGRLGVAIGTLVGVAVPAALLPRLVATGLGAPLGLSALRAARACWPGVAAIAAAAVAGVLGPSPDDAAGAILAGAIGIAAGVAATLLGGTTPADRQFARQMLRRAFGRGAPAAERATPDR